MRQGQRSLFLRREADSISRGHTGPVKLLTQEGPVGPRPLVWGRCGGGMAASLTRERSGLSRHSTVSSHVSQHTDRTRVTVSVVSRGRGLCPRQRSFNSTWVTVQAFYVFKTLDFEGTQHCMSVDTGLGSFALAGQCLVP